MIDYFENDLKHVLKHTEEYWKKIQGKTIFLTGGTGFFGVWLQMSFIYSNRSLNLNSRLIVLTRNENRFLDKHPWVKDYNEISFLTGDINNFRFIDDKIHYVIHAATEASDKLNNEHPMQMFETIVNGTKRILEFSKFKSLEGLLLTSSGAVYGKQPPFVRNIPEDYVGGPKLNSLSSVYAESKRMSEALSSVYYQQHGVPVKIARCFAFLGPYLPLDSHFAAGNFIKNALQGNDIVIKSDGSPQRSYMYPSDLMIWLWTILFTGETNRPYNVGSDQSITLKDLAQVIRQVSNNSNKIGIHLKDSISESESKSRYIPSIELASNSLGLNIYIDINEAVIKTLDFHNKKMNNIS
jgi:dTDP-glucose 4,6-dehydratase